MVCFLYDERGTIKANHLEGEATTTITFTPAAQEKVREYLGAQEQKDLALRIYISKGGCSGFSYGMALDQPKSDDDTIQVHDVQVVVDPQSAPYLDGITVDYINSLMGGGFSIENPNAASTCSCGHSFRTGNEKGAPAACSH